MKVFISWSGGQSRKIATMLKHWLPDVLQQVDAWMSEHDIDAGARWSSQLTTILSECNIGIIILTPENQKSPWVLFEAGALSKSIDASKVIPFLVGMSPADVEAPLSQFQAVMSTKHGVKKLLNSINTSLPHSLTEERLDRLLDKWWDDLDNAIKEIIKSKSPALESPIRPDREVLNEVLQLVRSISKESSNASYLYEDRHKKKILLNTKPIFCETGRMSTFVIPPGDKVSGFLDRVYFLLNEDGSMEPFEYGKSWLLKNTRTGHIFNDIGTEYNRSKGEIKDNTYVFSLDIDEDDILEVISV